jgi:hypothetical protein
VLIAGNIALQIPLGLLSESYPPRNVLIGCAAASALGCLMLPVVIGTALQWPFVFVWALYPTECIRWRSWISATVSPVPC